MVGTSCSPTRTVTGTPLRTLEGVPALPMLASLWADQCSLVRLGAPVGARWPRLTALELAGNVLADVDDLATSPAPTRLRRLRLGANRVRDAPRLLRALHAVRASLVDLDLRDNPSTQQLYTGGADVTDRRSAYRAAVVRAVGPGLDMLDDQPVTAAERERRRSAAGAGRPSGTLLGP